jgi:hypothetical protein
VRIAVHLVKILKPLVEGRKDSFSRFCEAEVRREESAVGLGSKEREELWGDCDEVRAPEV